MTGHPRIESSPAYQLPGIDSTPRRSAAIEFSRAFLTHGQFESLASHSSIVANATRVLAGLVPGVKTLSLPKLFQFESYAGAFDQVV